MNVKVVLNPYANRWRAKQAIPTIEAALKTAGCDYDLALTTEPGRGVGLAETAVFQGFDAVVAAGGDGTINEVVNGILQATLADERTLPFGIIPLGSANDFSDMAKLPRDVAAAVSVVTGFHTRQIDAGQVNGYYFINNSAVAMEPMVTLEHVKMQRLHGQLRYLVALVKAIVKLQAWQMRIQWDGGGYDGPAYLLSVCNGPRTGGFMMAPDAQVDDGRFDFVFAPEVAKTTVLTVLLRLLRGTHIYHPAVTYGQTTQLTIESYPATPIHADGELFSQGETAVSYQILPGKVTLLVPWQ